LKQPLTLFVEIGKVMTSDLLFSILPCEGKVAIKHDSQKVVKIDRLEELRVLNDEEKELKGEEREAKKSHDTTKMSQAQSKILAQKKLIKTVPIPKIKK
jgi:hypothetical protein